MNQNTNNSSSSSGCCYFHRREIVIGICALCLNERLLILASKQASSNSNSSYSKIFAFGSYLFNGGGTNHRLEVVDLKSGDGYDYDDCASATSQDDSFISIKFEDNGDTSWDKAKNSASKVSLEQCKVTTWNHGLRKATPKWGAVEPSKGSFAKESKRVIEHAKPRGSLRLRKKIGHLFQLIKWKRSNKTNVRHVRNKVDGFKVGKNWIRTLIKRTTR